MAWLHQPLVHLIPSCSDSSVESPLRANSGGIHHLCLRESIPVVRCPPEDLTEDMESVWILRCWNDRLWYEIMVSAKAASLGHWPRVRLTLDPLEKTDVSQLNAYISIWKSEIYAQERWSLHCKFPAAEAFVWFSQQVAVMVAGTVQASAIHFPWQPSRTWRMDLWKWASTCSYLYARKTSKEKDCRAYILTFNVSEHQTLVTSESGPGDQFELLPIDDWTHF